jgi:hypothetical protein
MPKGSLTASNSFEMYESRDRRYHGGNPNGCEGPHAVTREVNTKDLGEPTMEADEMSLQKRHQ